MKCWVCNRQARGFGHTDNRHGVGNPRRYPIDWVFCSKKCQDVFHAMYGNWQRVLDGRIDIKEVAMIDPSEIELASKARELCARDDFGFREERSARFDVRARDGLKGGQR